MQVICISYLWKKHHTQSAAAACDDHKGHNAELHIWLILPQHWYTCANQNHWDWHKDTESDTPAVIYGRDVHVSCGPGQETGTQLDRRQGHVQINSVHLPSVLLLISNESLHVFNLISYQEYPLINIERSHPETHVCVFASLWKRLNEKILPVRVSLKQKEKKKND